MEAIADESLPGGGPGLPPNGNFVVTEITVHAGTDSNALPETLPVVKIAGGKADFLQPGFSLDLTFDGNSGNQNGWAVSPKLPQDHWATFQFADEVPTVENSKTRLRFVIAQNHPAANHLLGRFRISLTTHPGDIPLSTTETLAIASTAPPQHGTEAQTKLLRDYVQAQSGSIQVAQAQVAVASKPLPADEKLVALQARHQRLAATTAEDAGLITLRENVQRSETQREHGRLTAT